MPLDFSPSYVSTAQEIFDLAAAHMLAQNARSALPGGPCQYRGPDGLKCAVGALLTDEEAALCSNTATVYHLRHARQLPGRLIPHVELLGSLQSLHDGTRVEDWPIGLAKVAATHGLDW